MPSTVITLLKVLDFIFLLFVEAAVQFDVVSTVYKFSVHPFGLRFLFLRRHFLVRQTSFFFKNRNSGQLLLQLE